MYKNYFKPVLIYGAETWTIIKKDLSRIQETEMKFLRHMLGKPEERI